VSFVEQLFCNDELSQKPCPPMCRRPLARKRARFLALAHVRVGGDFKPSQIAINKERLPLVSAGLLLLWEERNYVRLNAVAAKKGHHRKPSVGTTSWP
jgi:hypothetical protein